jgi:hypothetical protein
MPAPASQPKARATARPWRRDGARRWALAPRREPGASAHRSGAPGRPCPPAPSRGEQRAARPAPRRRAPRRTQEPWRAPAGVARRPPRVGAPPEPARCSRSGVSGRAGRVPSPGPRGRAATIPWTRAGIRISRELPGPRPAHGGMTKGREARPSLLPQRRPSARRGTARPVRRRPPGSAPGAASRPPLDGRQDGRGNRQGAGPVGRRPAGPSLPASDDLSPPSRGRRLSVPTARRRCC